MAGYQGDAETLRSIANDAYWFLGTALFLAIHLVIFYFQGFYKSKLRRAKIDDFLYIILNAGLTILIAFSILNYLYNYSQGPAPTFHVSFKLSHGFLAVYFFVVIFMLAFLRTQIFFFMKRRYARGLYLTNVVVVGAGEMGRVVAQKLFTYKDLGFRIKGFLDDERTAGESLDVDGGLVPVLGGLKDLGRVIEEQGVGEVFIALDPAASGRAADHPLKYASASPIMGALGRHNEGGSDSA